MTKRILIILTSHNQMGDTGNNTGFWLEEFAAPYYVFKDAGMDITLASPAGGAPPVDPNSEADAAQTEDTRRLIEDSAALNLLAQTQPLAQINPNEYDAVFYPGGHGPLWDLSENRTSIELIEQFDNQGKPIAAVCHGPVVFQHAQKPSGQPVLTGRKVTCFTDSEEQAVGLTKVVPFSLQQRMIQNGALFSCADDWQEYSVVDDNLITGQNPASSRQTAEKLLDLLKS